MDSIKIIQGDITNQAVTFIVNAANSSLLGGGGVDGAIHSKAGPALLEECKSLRNTQYPSGLDAGKAVLTSAYNLPSRFVIHTVGPIYADGRKNEAQTLESAYRSCLEVAVTSMENQGLHEASIAFPAISTGIYGYPKKEAAQIAIRTILSYLESNIINRDIQLKVLLVLFSASDFQIVKDVYVSQLAGN